MGGTVVSGGFNRKRVAVDLAVDLTTLLARNAYDLIERDDNAFTVVRSRRGHSGSQSRKLDIDCMTLAQRWATLGRVTALAPDDIHLETEEASRGFDPSTEHHPIFVRLDDFDGTTNASATAAGWSTACLVFIWSPRYGRYVLAGGSIALFDGHCVSFIDKTRHNSDGSPKRMEADVRLAKFDLFSTRELGCTDAVATTDQVEVEDTPSDGDFDVVAVNASGPERYAKACATLATVLQAARFRTLLAGTPIVYAALRGRIGLIVDPEASTLHDSTHLFVLNAMGWTTVDLETQKPIDLIKIAEAAATEDGSDRPIPPNATYRDAAALKLLGVA